MPKPEPRDYGQRHPHNPKPRFTFNDGQGREKTDEADYRKAATAGVR